MTRLLRWFVTRSHAQRWALYLLTVAVFLALFAGTAVLIGLQRPGWGLAAAAVTFIVGNVAIDFGDRLREQPS